jgi:hypothetical protein
MNLDAVYCTDRVDNRESVANEETPLYFRSHYEVWDVFLDVGRLLRLGATAGHVAEKLSAVPALSTQAFPFTDLFERVHLLLRAFAPERIMWGSDGTRTEQFYYYAEGLHYITQSIELTLHEKSLILGQSLRNVFSWRRPSDPLDGPGAHCVPTPP